MIGRLEEFNREANEMFNLNFVKNPKVVAYRMHYKKIPQFEYHGPIIEEDEVKAVCNDLRKFIQNRDDALCIKHLVPIYQSGLIGEKAKKMFEEAKQKQLEFRQWKTGIQIQDHTISYGEVFYVFLYGKISHKSQRASRGGESPKETYEQWEKSGLYVPLKSRFITALRNYLDYIGRIVEANEEALKDLKSNHLP